MIYAAAALGPLGPAQTYALLELLTQGLADELRDGTLTGWPSRQSWEPGVFTSPIARPAHDRPDPVVHPRIQLREAATSGARPADT